MWHGGIDLRRFPLGVHRTTTTLTWRDRWVHVLARLGWRRTHHRVCPGLYAVGNPTPDAPVFVTANYALSFDALRSALGGIDGYILVLDTEGINVWCAAGKGTFGTEELLRRIEATRLREVVRHRTLILPQLGAAGVCAHEVQRRSGFRVEYAPVRAKDLPAYLRMGRATPEMRRVRFGLADRLVLIPVEVVHVLWPTAVVGLVLWFLAGRLAAFGALAAVLAGVVAFPILLPWIPTRDFSSKGFLLGGLVALPFALKSWLGNPDGTLVSRLLGSGTFLLGLPPVTAFLALNFTGSTPFTSRSGVRREILRYVRSMAGLFAAGLVLLLISIGLRLAGG
ncbi:MAG: mercury methylation corrinoid protein HgcA [Chloroflexia bacterium]